MQKRKVQIPKIRNLWDMPKRYEYLKKLVSDVVWDIAEKLEEKEAGAGDGTIPRRITLEINLEPNPHDLPIVTKEKFEFGRAYQEQMESVYFGGPASMGMPSWYTSDPYLMVGRKIFDQMLQESKGKIMTKAKKQLKKIGKR